MNSTAVRQKLPITPATLTRFFELLSTFTTTLDSVFWDACLVAFFSVFRKSNLLVPSAAAFDPHKFLRWRDVLLYKWGLMLVVLWSKTVQYRNQTLLVPVPKVEHSNLFPLIAVVHAFNVAGVLEFNEHASSPAVTYRKNGALLVVFKIKSFSLSKHFL